MSYPQPDDDAPDPNDRPGSAWGITVTLLLTFAAITVIAAVATVLGILLT